MAVYDVIGSASVGQAMFARNSLKWPDPVSKVKLLLNHDMANPIGVATSITEDEQGLMASFTVPPGEAGDAALAEAKSGIRDGLSVGVQVEQTDKNAPTGLTRVTLARIYEVSLVSVPAFENTLVSSVTAARNTNYQQEEIPMPKPEEQKSTDEKATEQEGAPAPSGLTASINNQGTAPAPGSENTPLTVTAAADRLIQGVREGMSAGSVMTQLTAALTDVVPANDRGEAYLRKSWIGEVWQAANAPRPMIDAFGTPSRLDGLKAYGWKWAKTPRVGKYASNKTEVPSNELSMVPVEGDAQDFAAAWDVARKYIDIGATGFIERIFQLAADDYRRQTEAWFTGKIKAGATNDPAVTSVLAAVKTLPRKFAGLGANLSVLQFGETAWGAFLDLTESEVPWWLRNQGSVDLSNLRGVAANVAFGSNSSLGANEVIAADSRAATYYELGGTPIRAQALDIPRGGIDVGVYGYAAAIINDPRAIVKATITPAG